MQEEKFSMFSNRLQKVYRHIGKSMRRQGIHCFRIYDRDIPEFPFCIELYDDMVYLAEYQRRFEMADDLHEAWLDRCMAIVSDVTGMERRKIFLRERKRKQGRLDQYKRMAEERKFHVVKEGGLQFLVNLTDYLDTGLFLDHRITRALIRDQAKGKRILNLFCYTGSFSVYAAAGGAAEVVSVDLSNTYLGWAKENMALNGFRDKTKYRFVKADVMQYLGTLSASAFDIIVIDPPTFSNSKAMEDMLDIQRDHVSLLNQALHALKPGGLIYFSTNYRKFQLNPEKIQAMEIKDITTLTTPEDFRGSLFRYCFRIRK